jgi:Xaa-Pro aminopeptidase
MQEAGPRKIRDGELLAFDTDLVGPYGYCADISRTWYCGEDRPSVEVYIGEVGGKNGVKLEDQVLITETGVENLTRCPFDERLMA